MTNKYISRVTSSARGEIFNPLLWPFLLTTLVYGIGFAIILPLTGSGGTSSLYASMSLLGEWTPILWGLLAIANIVIGFTFLLFNIPPAGKASGLAGFMLWLFAGFCYLLSGDLLVLFAVALPNTWFWIWQYLSLSLFSREEALDKRTMERYNDGEYDDELNPKDSRISRESNRGQDLQT